MKILIIFTGGTIGSARHNAVPNKFSITDAAEIGGIISPDSHCRSALLDTYPNSENIEFTTACPYTILSENLNADNLNSLYDCISSHDLSAFDGVIVTHGTDTLQYTAAFLGFAFANSKTPIVLVSANYPLEDERSNGAANFAAAVDFIRSRGGSGVFAAYKNEGENAKIHRAEKLLAHAAYSDEIHSIFDEYYGELIDGRFCKNSAYRETHYDFSPSHPIRLEQNPNVLFIRLSVPMTYPKLTRETRAVLIEGWHSGTLPTSDSEFVRFCKTAEKLKIPVYLTGAQKGFFYESKLMFDELKIKVLEPMPPIAAYMMLCLKN